MSSRITCTLDSEVNRCVWNQRICTSCYLVSIVDPIGIGVSHPWIRTMYKNFIGIRQCIHIGITVNEGVRQMNVVLLVVR